MNKILSIIAAVCFSSAASAQTLNIEMGNVTYAIPAGQAEDMYYSSDNTLTISGKTYALVNLTRMYIDDKSVDDNTVLVTYSDNEAHVLVAGNIAAYVDPTITGAHVAISQSEAVGDATCGEITYTLSGTGEDAGFALSGTYKATIELRGVDIHNPSGAALDIQDGKRISLSIKSGTFNRLSDGAGGTQKGCIVCRGHLELKGKGTLNIEAATAHGIYSKEYVTMKNCTVNILSAAKDGVNCNQYFMLESGMLNIDAVGDDALQVSYKDDTDREAEDTGSVTISGGTFTAMTAATAAKGIKADGNIEISDGVITICVSGGGEWDSEDAKTKASACIKADGDISITGGTLNLTATGGGGKGISADGNLTIEGGDISIATTGGMYVYTNNTEYQNYTGNADRIDSDNKSSAKGIKVDGTVTINGGNINISTKSNGAEGIESKSTLTIADGNITIYSYDDAINSSSHMYINGGDITVIATNNDGLDSNGNLYISGGNIRTFGAGAPECGLDANEEEGYSVFFTGGTVFAVGGGNSVPESSQSTQAYIVGNGTVSAGQTVTLSSGSTTLATFIVPDNYTSTQGGRPAPGGNRPGGGRGGILITCPALVNGSSYTLTIGTSSMTVTAKN